MAMDNLNEPGGALTAHWLLTRVLECESCCQSCRALIATFVECEESAKLVGCPHCGFPKFSGDTCPCEQYIGKPTNPASVQFKDLMSGPLLTESEEKGWEEFAEAGEEARARAEEWA